MSVGWPLLPAYQHVSAQLAAERIPEKKVSKINAIILAKRSMPYSTDCQNFNARITFRPSLDVELNSH